MALLEFYNYLFLNNTNEDLQQDLHSKLLKTMLEKSGFYIWFLKYISYKNTWEFLMPRQQML